MHKNENCTKKTSDSVLAALHEKTGEIRLTRHDLEVLTKKFHFQFWDMEIFDCSKCLDQVKKYSVEYFQHMLDVFEYEGHILKSIKKYELVTGDFNENLKAEREAIARMMRDSPERFEFYCRDCGMSYNLLSNYNSYLNCKNQIHKRFIRYPASNKIEVGLNRKIADSIISMVGPIVTIRETSEIRTYHDGRFCVCPDEKIKFLIEKLVIAPNTSLIREVIASIKNITYKSLDEFDTDSETINLKNGLFNIVTGELRPHTPDYPSLVQFQVEYDPNAKCRVFNEYLVKSIPNEKMRQWAIEGLSLILLHELNLKKALFVVGNSDAGKSIFLSISENILGTENYASLTVHQIEEDRFAASVLVGKRANISHDISNSKILTSSTFKNLIDRRSIYIQKKGQNGFSTALDSHYIFSLNTCPQVDESAAEGFFNRVILVIFSKQFKISPTKKDLDNGILPADPELEKKIKFELPGIFNILLAAMRKIKSQNCITNLPNSDEIEKVWNSLANPIQDWIDVRIIKTGDHKTFVTLEDFYRDYASWTMNRGEKVFSYAKFLKLASQLFDKSNRTDPRFETYSKCFTGCHIVGEGRHDNLKSFDYEFDAKIEHAKKNFSFDESGFLKCKRCGGFENLVTAIKHDCSKCNTKIEEFQEHSK
ncbi:MAG: hypothetical protein KGI19_09595 [Thaumarchaeota archaeon]|nr:hypothetical protein [Nitrososphaerota archaeon]